MKNEKKLFYILLFLAMIGWGASWVNAKVLSRYIDAFDMIFFRFGATALTMVPIIIVLKKSFKIDIRSLAIVFVSSLILIAYMRYFFLGTTYGTASLGGALVTTLVPINTFILLVILGKKRMTKMDVFALVIGAIGVMSMLNVWKFDIKEITVVQNLYFILASLLWPILTIVSSKSTKISPIVFTFYLYLITIVLDGLLFVDFGSIRYGDFDYLFWINMGSLVLLATTYANTVYFLGIEKLGADGVSSFIFFVPFSAILLSAIFLGERISPSILIGTILTVVAVKLLNR
ncbi:MAG: DMT family transporter [Epsilonproteobacteria bacterium]|nr:DMT family transporter [Campylobacterota bacterium]